MTAMQISQIIAAVGTIVTGLVSLIRPRSVAAFTGLRPTGPRGITEIRAVLGAAFVGLGMAPLVLRIPATFRMLGITYLFVAAGRVGSMLIDKSFGRSNIISLVVEIVFGVILAM